MELVQEYIELKHPSPSRIRKNYEFYGHDLGTISDGERTVEFAYNNLQVNVKQNSRPIHTMGSPYPSFFSRESRRVEIKMNIPVDNNEIYSMLVRSQNNLKVLKTGEFEANVYTEEMSYIPFDYSHNGMFIEVTFVSSGEVKVIGHTGF